MEIGHFSRSAAARRPLLHPESPGRASEGSPGTRGQEPVAPPWVSVPTNSSPLSPNRPPLVDSGGEVRRGGPLVAERRASRFVVCVSPSATKREFREAARSCPLTLALSPNTRNVLGEREQMVGTQTQGETSSSCRWSGPGLQSAAPLGLYAEEAASCRFTNVQSLVTATG